MDQIDEIATPFFAALLSEVNGFLRESGSDREAYSNGWMNPQGLGAYYLTIPGKDQIAETFDIGFSYRQKANKIHFTFDVAHSDGAVLLGIMDRSISITEVSTLEDLLAETYQANQTNIRDLITTFLNEHT